MESGKKRGLDTLLQRYVVDDVGKMDVRVKNLARVLLAVDKDKLLLSTAVESGANTAYIAGFSENLVVDDLPASDLITRSALELGVTHNVVDIIQEKYRDFDERIIIEWEHKERFYFIKASWTL